MSNYKDILGTYVTMLGQTNAIHMGASAEFTAENKAELTRQLRGQYKQNQALVWIATALWVILFLVAIYFALYYRDNLKGLSVALGGNLMVVSGIMLALRRLWLDTSSIGALLAILPGLTPKDAAKVITSFYLNATKKDKTPINLVPNRTASEQ